MKIAFKTPHTKLSGGVKVIFDFANGLSSLGFDVDVLSKKMSQTGWYNKKFNFNLIEHKELACYGYDYVLDYGDGEPFVPHDGKHILFLQGFGTQNSLVEKTNLFYKYDWVVATSKWLCDLAVKCGQTHTSIIPPGIDEIFTPNNPKKKNITIGGLYHTSEMKNHEMLLNVFSKLGNKYKNINFLLLSATSIDSLKILDHRIQNVSTFVNPSQSLLVSMYNQCTAWVSTSLNEGFGLTTLEAMACGVPVVWVNSYGLSEYMDHGSNCIIANNDKEHITNCVMKLINDGSARNTIVKNSIKTAGLFNWDKSLQKMVKLLKHLSR